MTGPALPAFGKPNKNRSANMRAIRSNGNRSTELCLRALLIQTGCRGWRTHSKEFLGTPDFVFPAARVVIFMDGCFWHGCPACGHIPKTNMEYWAAKIGRNKKRDRRYSRELRKQGFKVIRIWECALKRYPDRCLKHILAEVS